MSTTLLPLPRHKLAEALDVNDDTVDHWILEGWLHPTGEPCPDDVEPCIDRDEVLRFIRQHHLTIHHPEALHLKHKKR